MYAVVKTGGKQYRVEAGETIKVEKIEGNPGDTIELSDVLFVADGEAITIGRPVVPGASVKAEIVDQYKDRKVLIYKFRRRKRYHRKNGHRQPLTSLKIVDIDAPSATA